MKKKTRMLIMKSQMLLALKKIKRQMPIMTSLMTLRLKHPVKQAKILKWSTKVL